MNYDVFRENGRWRVATAGHYLPGKFSKREAVKIARLLAGWRGSVRVQTS